MSEVEFKIEGLEDLEEDLKKAMKIMPDYGEKTLDKIGKEFKKDVKKKAEERTDKHSGNLLRRMSISKVKGFKENMYKEFSGGTKYFHLIEDGHEIVTPKTRTVTRKGKKVIVKLKNGGESKGFVTGQHMLRDTVKEYETKMPEIIRQMVDDIFKECDL